MYTPKASWPEFGNAEVAKLRSVTLSPEYEVKVTLRQ